LEYKGRGRKMFSGGLLFCVAKTVQGNEVGEEFEKGW
jgi:hypothetical protein